MPSLNNDNAFLRIHVTYITVENTLGYNTVMAIDDLQKRSSVRDNDQVRSSAGNYPTTLARRVCEAAGGVAMSIRETVRRPLSSTDIRSFSEVVLSVSRDICHSRKEVGCRGQFVGMHVEIDRRRECAF